MEGYDKMMQGGEAMVGGGAVLGNGTIKTSSPAAIQFSLERLSVLVMRASRIADTLEDSLAQFGGGLPQPEQTTPSGLHVPGTLGALNQTIDDASVAIDRLERLAGYAKELIG